MYILAYVQTLHCQGQISEQETKKKGKKMKKEGTLSFMKTVEKCITTITCKLSLNIDSITVEECITTITCRLSLNRDSIVIKL